LDIGARALALNGSLVEVAEVVLGSDALLMLVTALSECSGALTYMALMELMSKPNRPPPMMEMAAMR
jgi:hypothetical protein